MEVLQVPIQNLNFEIRYMFITKKMTEKETIICAIYRYVLIYYSIGDKVVKESQKSLSSVYSLVTKERNNLPQIGRFLLTKVLYEKTTKKSGCYTEQ